MGENGGYFHSPLAQLNSSRRRWRERDFKGLFITKLPKASKNQQWGLAITRLVESTWTPRAALGQRTEASRGAKRGRGDGLKIHLFNSRFLPFRVFLMENPDQPWNGMGFPKKTPNTCPVEPWKLAGKQRLSLGYLVAGGPWRISQWVSRLWK